MTMEKKELIEKYIFEMKGVKVVINPPNNQVDLMLFELAYSVALNYYKNNG